ncbi:hypothetical protein HPHPH16_0087 [Helicobacter pylori Hp H-16]|nr:hypothetical protein HPHPH16_0087 [Helicobacter pylori Hp H-16]
MQNIPYAFMILLSNKATKTPFRKIKGGLKVLSVKFLLRMA